MFYLICAKINASLEKSQKIIEGKSVLKMFKFTSKGKKGRVMNNLKVLRTDLSISIYT